MGIPVTLFVSGPELRCMETCQRMADAFKGRELGIIDRLGEARDPVEHASADVGSFEKKHLDRRLPYMQLKDAGA